MVQGKDLLKLYPFISLIPLLCRMVTARIPLQSENAFGAFSDSFPPGEAIGAPAPKQTSNRAINCNLPHKETAGPCGSAVKFLCIRFGGSQFLQQAIEPEETQHEQNIQHRHDADIQTLRRRIAHSSLHGGPDSLQGRDVAAVEVIEIGLQHLSHGGGDGAVADDKQQHRFVFALVAGGVEVQPHNQQERKHHNVVEGDGVEIKEICEKALHISGAVDQAGIDEHQPGDGGAQTAGDGPDLFPVLAPVKSGQGQHENEERTEMQRDVIKVIASLEGQRLLSNLQQHDDDGQDPEGDHPHVQRLAA